MRFSLLIKLPFVAYMALLFVMNWGAMLLARETCCMACSYVVGRIITLFLVLLGWLNMLSLAFDERAAVTRQRRLFASRSVVTRPSTSLIDTFGMFMNFLTRLNLSPDVRV